MLRLSEDPSAEAAAGEKKRQDTEVLVPNSPPQPSNASLETQCSEQGVDSEFYEAIASSYGNPPKKRTTASNQENNEDRYMADAQSSLTLTPVHSAENRPLAEADPFVVGDGGIKMGEDEGGGNRIRSSLGLFEPSQPAAEGSNHNSGSLDSPSFMVGPKPTAVSRTIESGRLNVSMVDPPPYVSALSPEEFCSTTQTRNRDQFTRPALLAHSTSLPRPEFEQSSTQLVSPCSSMSPTQTTGQVPTDETEGSQGGQPRQLSQGQEATTQTTRHGPLDETEGSRGRQQGQSQGQKCRRRKRDKTSEVPSPISPSVRAANSQMLSRNSNLSIASGNEENVLSDRGSIVPVPISFQKLLRRSAVSPAVREIHENGEAQSETDDEEDYEQQVDGGKLSLNYSQSDEDDSPSSPANEARKSNGSSPPAKGLPHPLKRTTHQVADQPMPLPKNPMIPSLKRTTHQVAERPLPLPKTPIIPSLRRTTQQIDEPAASKPPLIPTLKRATGGAGKMVPAMTTAAERAASMSKAAENRQSSSGPRDKTNSRTPVESFAEWRHRQGLGPLKLVPDPSSFPNAEQDTPSVPSMDYNLPCIPADDKHVLVLKKGGECMSDSESHGFSPSDFVKDVDMTDASGQLNPHLDAGEPDGRRESMMSEVGPSLEATQPRVVLGAGSKRNTQAEGAAGREPSVEVVDHPDLIMETDPHTDERGDEEQVPPQTDALREPGMPKILPSISKNTYRSLSSTSLEVPRQRSAPRRVGDEVDGENPVQGKRRNIVSESDEDEPFSSPPTFNSAKANKRIEAAPPKERVSRVSRMLGKKPARERAPETRHSRVFSPDATTSPKRQSRDDDSMSENLMGTVSSPLRVPTENIRAGTKRKALAQALRPASPGPTKRKAAPTAPRSARQQSPESPTLSQMRAPVCNNACDHCGTTYTTSWRDGPEGKKTLCVNCAKCYRQHGKLDGLDHSRSAQTKPNTQTASAPSPNMLESPTDVPPPRRTNTRVKDLLRNTASAQRPTSDRPKFTYLSGGSTSSSSDKDDVEKDGDYVEGGLRGKRRKLQDISESPKRTPTKTGSHSRGRKTGPEPETQKRAKRLRTERPPSQPPSQPLSQPVSNPSKQELTDGSRVWALWNNGLYYAGIINAHMRPTNRYSISYEDGSDAMVQASEIRPFDLKVGDECLALSCNGISQHCTVTEIVEPGAVYHLAKLGKEKAHRVVVTKIAMSDSIFEKNESLHQKGEGRCGTPVDDDDIDESVALMGPMPTNKRLFRGYGLVLTLPTHSSVPMPSHDENDAHVPKIDAAYVTKQILEGGGTVLKNFRDVMTGRNRRETAPRELLLVAARPARTTKFLAALALGIQMVSWTWVRDCCMNNGLEDYGGYQVSFGWSLETFNWFGNTQCTPQGVFKDLNMYVLNRTDQFKSDWEYIIRSAGATAISKKALRPNTTQCDYVLCENAPSREEMTYIVEKTDAKIVSTE
ncbi:hypothetical protein HK104_001847, partial [Borealophlyctis nickersoniae]